MKAGAYRESESDAIQRRMLAHATLLEHLATGQDSPELGMRLLTALRDDVEAFAVYQVSESGSLILMLQAGCAQAPPANALSAVEMGGPPLAAASAPGGGAVWLDLEQHHPAWAGRRARALAAIPSAPDTGGRRGLVLFALGSTAHRASLGALLNLGARAIVEALMRRSVPDGEPADRAHVGTRVLLIDDEALLVALVKRILERAGFVFHSAQSARAGFDLAGKVRPDVILVDKVLPDQDGIALLRRMRADPVFRTVPVIMLSGQADEAARLAALEEGADDVVAKPFSAKDLVARIEANVRLVRLRRATVLRQGELARLQQSQQELRTLLDTVQRVRDDERRMLAREVHDQLGQLLNAARIDIRLLQNRLGAPGAGLPVEQIVVELDAALSSVDLAIKAVQDIATLLRPPELEEGGLLAALRWQVQDLQRRTGIDCTVLHDPADYVEPPPFVAGELLRMCQEALTNVLRHAGATHILVQVVMRNACLVVRICDNGGGIPRAKLHDAGSLGLKGMRERAASIGATVHMHGRRGRGTMVAIRRRLAFV